MFCNKCGSILDENGKCSKCNNMQNMKYKSSNMQHINNIDNQNNVDNPKKKKGKKSGCLIVFLIILTILIGVFFVLPFVKNKIEEHKQNSITALKELTSSEKIGKDFVDGNITADEYVKQLAYITFEFSKLDSKYNSNNKEKLYNNVLDIAEKHQNELSKETILYLYKKFTLSDVNFDVNTKKSDLDKPKYGAVYAAQDDSLRTTINKAKISENKKFLIWYTDKGDSKVSDKDVDELAREIEDAVKKLEDEFGIEYKFNSSSGSGTEESSKTKKKMKEILDNNGIDEKYIDNCMNIYMCYTNNLKKDTENGALAYYCPNMSWLLKKAAGIIDDGRLGEITTVPNFPYVNIRPDATKDKQELKLIYTHELFHHFQKYYCGNGKYEEPKSGNFTVETTANWASAKVNDSNNKENIFSNWATKYVLNCDKKLDRTFTEERAGYANFVFAEIYSNFVEDGKKKMLDSMKKEDALDYLVKQAGDKFDDVMLELSKQNILNEFEHKTFKAYELPENSLELTMQLTKHSESVSSYAMKYYYLNKKDFKYNTYIDISSKYANLNYVLFGKKRGKYTVIENGEINSKNNFTIETNKYFKEYDQVVFSIVNDRHLSGSYEIVTMKEQLAKTIIGTDDFINNNKRLSILDRGEYIELHVSNLVSLFRQLSDLVRVGGNLGLQESNDANVQKGIQEMIKELDEFDKGLNELEKSNMKVVRISSIPINKKIGNENLHESIKDSYPGFKFKIVDTRPDNSTRITVGLIADLLAKNKLSFYVICTSGSSDSFAYFIEFADK